MWKRVKHVLCPKCLSKIKSDNKGGFYCEECSIKVRVTMKIQEDNNLYLIVDELEDKNV